MGLSTWGLGVFFGLGDLEKELRRGNVFVLLAIKGWKFAFY